MLVISLDRFRRVNDLQGHGAGDVVLCEVARRLSALVHDKKALARIGGDEFAMVVEYGPPNDTGEDIVIVQVYDILQTLEEPIATGQGHVTLGASIGIACYPTHGTDPEALMRSADIAMYRAKREAHDSFRFFRPDMDSELRAQALLEADLREAIAHAEIRPYYQPLIDIRDRRIYGFEILSRWQHRKRGAVPPVTFIALADQLGLIPELTASVLRHACRDAMRWPDTLSLSLNISPTQLRNPFLPAQILSILEEEDFPPARLEIEITETAFVDDLPRAKSILTALQHEGIKISLDDFGTGYSGLSHLRELKLDKVKIDRSFIQAMQHDSESEKIVDAILSLAKSLGLPAIAEGVESLLVLEQLLDKGCEYGQGFFFGEAMSAQSVGEVYDRTLQ